MKILIVEDSKVINNTLAQKLRIKGHLCVQSFSVRDINEALKDNCFDLVILDLHLPDGEGVEVFDLFKNQEETKIIIYTADENLDARTYFFQNGAIDYLTKNSSADKLLSDVDEIINRLENNRLNNILIVDDSVVVRKQLSQIFKVRNFNVFTASDKREARELAEKHDITFAIVDLILPDGNGEVLINNLRKMEKYSKLPIIAISSMSDPNVIKSVYKSGASDFLKKPIVFEELILKVNLWIDIINKDIKSKHNEQLLNEYKKAIDNSEIISKTDTKGVITYVNDKFCQISGYTPEELMGKPHNIIRHPDMESETFAGLWKMILNKETWRGTVKNMAKDGSAYWVDSTITPILDINGDISEFIAVRHDVTKIEAMKEELQDKLQMSSKNLWEMLAINTSYENAIGASNILSRTDTKGIITFVNEEFAKVSGYKASEVVGKSHNVIKHPDNNEDFYKNIWKTIKSNNIFRGVIKNRARDGKTFYAATTIVPIMNANEEILEYMAIRNDVTEIFELTDELQKTQHEIVSRMGSVAESRSKETAYHTKRVAEYSILLAQKLGLSDSEIATLYAASPMHDIGKVGIPDEILLKPGRLEDNEREIMKTHTQIGHGIFASSDLPVLKAASVVSLQHHEKWDGTGYPYGVAGEEIHIFARITALGDVFDALASNREYKKAWDMDKILELIKEESGRHFDPNIVDIFFKNIDDIIEIKNRYRD